MRLLTLGDSFTWGSELTDQMLAWPHLLAKMTGFAVDNQGQPGAGNTQMVRYAVEHVDTYDIVIVAWSHYARQEFADEHGIYDTWPGHRGPQFSGDVAFRKQILSYLNEHHNDMYMYKQYLINAIVLQNFLSMQGKKYIFLDAFGNCVYRKERWHSMKLYDQIDTSKWLGWPKETMIHWTFGVPQGPGGHFLEEGHQRVAEKINEHIRNLGWIS